jgi:putative ABC transport system ATP-binding protein
MCGCARGADDDAVMDDATAAVKAVGISKRYGSGASTVTALDDVSVVFARGQLTAIVGASGSGKSTLLHCLAGLDTPDSGEVYLGETALRGLSDRQLTRLRRERVGFVFQSYNLVPILTAGENIVLPLRLGSGTPDRAWIDTVIAAVGLQHRLAHRPAELSGGQQQRTAVARALATRPDVVFADEPTGNLDSVAGTDLLRFLRRSVDEFGQTVVMVTHDPTAVQYAHRAVFLSDGRVVDDVIGPTAEAVLSRTRRAGRTGVAT